MAWPKGQGKGEAQRFTVRLDPDTATFYRRKAKEGGVNISEFLRKTLHEGVIAENIQDVEDRLRALVSTAPAAAQARHEGIPDDLALSLVTCEALLTAIVEKQDPQVLYRAQEAAKVRVRKRRGA